MDISVSQVLKGLQLLYLTLGYSEMCAVQTRVLFLSLSGSSGGNSSAYDKSVSAMLDSMDQIVCLRGCIKECHNCP